MRRNLVEIHHPYLSLKRQCKLLGIGRTSLYYTPQTNEYNKTLMDAIDEMFTEDPNLGTRRLKAVLKSRYTLSEGLGKIPSLMRRMGLAAIYLKKDLSQSNKAHKMYPYLLRNLTVTRPNQVWSTNIYIKDYQTLISCRKGLGEYFEWYNYYREHSSLHYQTPMNFYFECVGQLKAA